MIDKYYVYRPLLDLIGFTEGTDKGDGYNETLAYGKMIDGVKTPKDVWPDINLCKMNLGAVKELQAKMLRDPDNNWNSSALGRYQIVGKTLRSIQKNLGLNDSELFNENMQDRMACYLLGVRGIDKYLSGRLKENTLINNLAKEWASLPTTENKGYYGGQHAAVNSDRVRAVLADVKTRHKEGQPVVHVPVSKPTVPQTVDKEIKQKTNWFGTGITLTGVIGAIWSAVQSSELQTILMFGGIIVVGGLIILVLGPWIANRIKLIRAEIEA